MGENEIFCIFIFLIIIEFVSFFYVLYKKTHFNFFNILIISEFVFYYSDLYFFMQSESFKKNKILNNIFLETSKLSFVFQFFWPSPL
jgi:hypothetical protein